MRLFRVHHPRAWSHSQYASNTMIRLPTAITRPLSHPRQHHLFVYFSTAKELIPDVGTPSLSCRNVRKKREKPFPVRVLHRTSANLDYNPPSPALSPLLNAETFLPYYKKHPKALPTAGNELSPREWALTVNPYGKFLFPVSFPTKARGLQLIPATAQILASHVRLDVDHHRRLPAMLLTRFTLKRHPRTKKPWLLPDGLDLDTPHCSPVGLYSLGTYGAVASLTPGCGRGGKVWAKLVPHQIRQAIMRSGVWRDDMKGFVREKMRQRVVDECKRARLSPEVDCVVGGPRNWVGMGEVVAVLDFRGGLTDGGDEDYEEQDRLVNMTSAGWRRREAPPIMDTEGTMARVGRKLVPVHRVKRMLGDEMEQQLRKAWRVEEGHEVVAVMLTQRTSQVLLWWMRLRGFLGLEYAANGRNI